MQDAPEIGSILLGKYRVERVLGQGGMGFVVAARHETLGQLCAIKFMLPDVLGFKDARERFVREARAAAKLNSDHVARVYDVGTLEDGAPYMVMEHLAGQDLKQVLDNRGHLPIEEAARYVQQACEAIAEAHEHGIVHRDLKPANLFLTRRANGSACIKVLDFGISKELDKVGPGLTKPGMAMGTPVYMAPEQIANSKAAEFRSDIWSLGIILHELVTGKPPFYSEIVMELIAQVVTNPPIPASRVRPGIPLEFEALILRCLEKKPEQRYASVREVSAALQPFVDGTYKKNHSLGPGDAEEIATVELKRAKSSPQLTIPAGPLVTMVPTDEPILDAGVDQKDIDFSGNKNIQTNRSWGSTARFGLVKDKKTIEFMSMGAGALGLLCIVILVVHSRRTSGNPVEVPSNPQTSVVSSESVMVPQVKPIDSGPPPAPESSIANDSTAVPAMRSSSSSAAASSTPSPPATSRTNGGASRTQRVHAPAKPQKQNRIEPFDH